jgi:hypothetical protein
MKPNVRRAMHQALDIVLDAMSEDEPSADVKKSRRRGPVQRELPPEPEVSPEVEAKIDAHLRRAGYRQAG